PRPPDEDPPPLSGATPQELRAHPGLARLLQGLGCALGPDGLSPPLDRELRQAEAELALRRGAWLRWESLWRGLQELLRDPRHLEPPVLRALEQALTLAELRRGPPAFTPLLPPPQALGRCGALLGRLAGEGCAGAQAELDRRRADYLEAKGAAMLLKIRLEELTLLLDTYPPEKVEAHRRIRAVLEAASERAAGEAAGARAALAAFGGLGPRFEALAGEYGRLRERLAHRRWALRQLRPHDP
ncbi:HAUS augmin-like complex subunit 4, partial [Ciconia boyciana]|uniref:HAUS augmin-like complex subunit 4 n=1 Tax=Ciconia boyciana TaxID=52775 RepID=UPI003BA2512D